MPFRIYEVNRTTAIMAVIFGLAGFATAMVFDEFYWQTPIFEEGHPHLHIGHLVRSLLICISTMAIFWAFIGQNRPGLVLIEPGGFPLEKAAIVGTCSTALFFLILFIFKSSTFSSLSLEDGPVEWASALILFSCSIVFIITLLTCHKNPDIPKITGWSLVLLALIFFVIGMEEVSWFQRALELKTPDVFGANHQGELNLHNFATNYVENAYYHGTCLFLVLMPFFYLFTPSLSGNRYLQLFVARPYIIVLATIPCAFNFDMWNIIFTQITFFSCVVILCTFALRTDSRNESVIILFVLVLIVLTQSVFLTNRALFEREWEVTEYKEFLIPLVYFAYSLDIYTRIKRVYQPKEA